MPVGPMDCDPWACGGMDDSSIDRPRMGDVARIYPPSVRGAVSTHRVATRDVGLALSLAIAVPLLCWGLTNP